ncbi:MAG: hypothetical protein JSS24_10140 [Proteobacteria bacterium]|nr:hypothetical protein [Pseudomonadota bacterium]
METPNLLLRGGISCFRLAQNKMALEDLDSWMRRRLRSLLWQQWNRP